MLSTMGDHSANPSTDDHVAESGDEQEAQDGREVPARAEKIEHADEVPATTSRGSGARWLGFAALLVALVALAISAIHVLRPAWLDKYTASMTSPMSSSSSTSGATTSAAAAAPSAQQVADAKKSTCDAYNVVGSAVTLRSNADLGPDPEALQAEVVSSNARVAFAVGHDYLMSHLDAATPPQLADAVRSFANDLQDVAINALAGIGNEDQAQADRLQNLVTLNDQIVDQCK